MDKYEKRRVALQKLADGFGRGGIARIAQAIAKEPNYVSRMLYPAGKKGRKRIGEDSVDVLDKAFPGWLDQGQHAPKREDMDLSNVVHLKQKQPEGLLIDQYDTGGAMGDGLELRDQPGIIQSWRVNPEWLERNVRSHSSAKNLCIVTGFGDSMQPLFNPGDPLLVDIGVTSVDFDSIYFFRIGNDGYVKRLQRIPTEAGLVIRAVSENRDAYETFDITGKMDFQVLGRILKVWCSRDF